MAEYIERETALQAAKKSHLYFDIKPIINSIPAADVRPVVRGKWIEEMVVGGFAESWESTCSICGKGYRDIGKPHFCPNCGADMRGEQDV